MIVIYLCLIFLSVICATTISKMKIISSLGFEFSPINSIQLLSNTFSSSRLKCAINCHEQYLCRIFDYDSLSGQCRLYQGDLRTGFIISSSRLNSVVVSVKISSELYSYSHNQECSKCFDSRYEECLNNTCQCPSHTYWNGNECLLQLFSNQTCTQIDACRKDLNITCLSLYQNVFTNCIATNLSVGTTVVGLYNGTSGSSADTLNLPRGISILNNGTTLIVSEEGNKRVQSYNLSLSKPSGSLVLQTPITSEYPSFIMSLNNSLYVSIPAGYRVQISPSNGTIPQSPTGSSVCIPENLVAPAGIASDSNGNIYIANQNCHCISRWKGSNITIIAGIINSSGNSNNMLWYPSGIYIDQDKDLYVSDTYNHRIQKYSPIGNKTGVTIAGGNGFGSASNQLNNPHSIYVSRLSGSIYISDHGNNRIQRWDRNAIEGITVAGNPSGISGNTLIDLNGPFSILLYPPNDETFLYVADWNNHRILRFPLS